MPAPLKRHHVVVLKALYDLHVRNNKYAWTFGLIAEQCGEGVLKSDVRRIVRFLKRRGYVEYTTCFLEDDYLANGSGHYIKAEGIMYPNKIGENQ